MTALKAAQASVLVIEDQNRTREAICEFLESKGFRALQARDGLEGLELYKRVGAEVVLVDAMLPKLHGFQVCRAIKNEPSGRDALVIVMTAVFKKGRYRSEAIAKYGADEFYVKPLDLEELLARITRHLSERMRKMIGRETAVGGVLDRRAGADLWPLPQAAAAAEALPAAKRQPPVVAAPTTVASPPLPAAAAPVSRMIDTAPRPQPPRSQPARSQPAAATPTPRPASPGAPPPASAAPVAATQTAVTPAPKPASPGAPPPASAAPVAATQAPTPSSSPAQERPIRPPAVGAEPPAPPAREAPEMPSGRAKARPQRDAMKSLRELEQFVTNTSIRPPRSPKSGAGGE